MIDVHTVVNRNSIPYYFYMIDNMKLLCSEETKLNFYCYCMNDVGDIDDFEKRGIHSIYKISHGTHGGSRAHAFGLNLALEKMNTNNINIFSDSDTAMVYPKWDLKLIELFSGGIDIIGTSYRSMEDHSSHEQASKQQCYKKGPNTTWLAINAGCNLNGLDLTPFTPTRIIPIRDEESSKVFNLPIGYDLLTDVGWRIPLHIMDNNLNYSYLKNINPTHKKSKVLKYDTEVVDAVRHYNEEYHLLEGIPFVMHQRGSSKHEFRNNIHSTLFYNKLEMYINGILDE